MNNKTLSLALTLSLFLSLSHNVSYGQVTPPPDVVDVLTIMLDSRKVRDLKYEPMEKQAAFTQTLLWKVYQPAYDKVLEHLRTQPEYKNMRMYVDGFRSHDANPNSVNTDNDIRVMVEVEPGHWKEADTRKWADKYYEAFAKQTGFQPDPNFKPVKTKAKMTEQDILAQQYQQHAGKYRQLATDQYHAEASRDYTDQQLKFEDLPDAHKRSHGQVKARIIHSSTFRQARDAKGELRYHSDGLPMFEREANISQVKKTKANDDGTFKLLSERALLRDAEGLSYMYLEKGDEQLKKAQNLEKKLRDTPDLSASERARIQDQINMHKTEAAAQIRKGSTSLAELRNAYERQGFNIGKTTSAFDEASQILCNVDGSSRTDIADVEAKLKRQGYNGLSDFSAKMQSQVETLKLARPVNPNPSVPSTPNPPSSLPTQPVAESSPRLPVSSIPNKKLVALGKAADVASTFLAMKETTQQVLDGKHLFVNLDQDDAALEQAGKIAAANLIDILGFTAGFQSGLAADDREKERIIKAIREGKTVSPLLSFVRASGEGVTEVLWNMATSPVVGPLDFAKEVVGYTMAARNERQAMVIANEQERQARNARWESFDKPVAAPVQPAGLGSMLGFMHGVGGTPLRGSVKPGQVVAFSVKATGDWNDSTRVEWLMKGQVYKSGTANTEGISQFRFGTDGLTGENTVAVRLVDVQSGKILAHQSTSFTIDAAPAVASSVPDKSKEPSEKSAPLSSNSNNRPTQTEVQTPAKPTPAVTPSQSTSTENVPTQTAATTGNTAQLDTLVKALQLKMTAYQTLLAEHNQSNKVVLAELQKVADHCIRVFESNKAALKQQFDMLQAKGKTVVDQEIEAYNQQAEAFNAKNRENNARGAEYNQFRQSLKGDRGHAILMAQNLPCAAGSGFNATVAKGALMRALELERTMAPQKADINKITAQIMQLKGAPDKKPESKESEYYQVYYIGIDGYVFDNLSKTPTKDFSIPRTICGTTFYDDGQPVESFYKRLKEATNPIFVIKQNGQELSRCSAR